jgi:hypothetical protein
VEGKAHREIFVVFDKRFIMRLGALFLHQIAESSYFGLGQIPYLWTIWLFSLP